ncbi:hypothetical protein [Oligoflexus tunisiensis]|uniref:hypothetical protein n=1 Tax=Oligoflexus tunisiensis TaxID=708132 RepID=UPI00114D12A4|nr:hypothetical protein [Oligoflexus tunisiensis]
MGQKKHLDTREKLIAGFEQQIRTFFQRHRPEDSILILDSTGPSATRHYLFLRALGMDRLQRMKAVHGFSGGAFAYFGFQAVHQKALQMPIENFYPSFDRIFRRCHHRHLLSPVQAFGNMALKRRSAFPPQVLDNVLRSIFAEEFLNRKLSSLPRNFVPYIGIRNQDGVANAREILSDDHSVRDLLLAVCRVPAFYGSPTCEQPYFDAAFAKGYRTALHNMTASGTPALVSTPWREGYKGQSLYVNCFGHRHQKWSMFKDFTLLMLNLPNRNYQHDLEAAFA